MRILILFSLVVFGMHAADAVRVSLPAAIETEGAWHLSKAMVVVPENTTAPRLISAPQRTPARALAVGALGSVSFDINEQGVPFGIQVDKTSDTELADEVIALIQEWRFEAALRAGVPVTTHAELDLSVGERRPVKLKRD